MGRNTWLTRALGGGALLCAALGTWSLLFRAGMAVERFDVAELWGAALVLTAGWTWAGSRPVRIPPRREVVPVPAPPGQLPLRPLRWVLRWLLVALLAVPAVAVVTELAGRADGDAMRRIAAVQEAGAVLVDGRITAVDRLVKNPSKWYDGDLEVEVPVRTGAGAAAAGGTTLQVRNAHLGQNHRDLGLWHELGILDAGRLAGVPQVPVLYAPTAPELGGVVDVNGGLGRYAAAAPPFAFGRPSLLVEALLYVPGCLMTLGLLAFLPRLRVPHAPRTLRDDARNGSALPAVRARVTGALRSDHTTRGNRDGAVAVRSTHRIRFELADGTEIAFEDGTRPPRQLALLAARLHDRPGWLCGARNWRLISSRQTVVFVTDEGEAHWMTMERAEFERVLASAEPVAPDPERRVALCPTPTGVVPGAHWPWLATTTAGYVAAVLVLTVPMSWAASFWLSLLVLALPAVATWRLLVRLPLVGGRTGAWVVQETRDPAIGPA
ncbi:hypothetical protein [Streptomyces sp. NPDC093225]|uniref:hypothetical protein n=1 Tax=Streptomyces sp. NPDC093225 TaxID=3366034 RepID=UPI0038273F92